MIRPFLKWLLVQLGGSEEARASVDHGLIDELEGASGSFEFA